MFFRYAELFVSRPLRFSSSTSLQNSVNSCSPTCVTNCLSIFSIIVAFKKYPAKISRVNVTEVTRRYHMKIYAACLFSNNLEKLISGYRRLIFSACSTDTLRSPVFILETILSVMPKNWLAFAWFPSSWMNLTNSLFIGCTFLYVMFYTISHLLTICQAVLYNYVNVPAIDLGTLK